MSNPNIGKLFVRAQGAARITALAFWAAFLVAGARPALAIDWIRCGGTCYESIEACATASCGPNTSCPACDPGGANNCTSDPTCAPSTNAPSAPVQRTRLVNPLGEGVTIEALAGRAIRGFLGVSGSFALLMFVYGGFMWVTSGGNPEKVKKGKQIFTYAVIGLVVMFGAYAFLTAFINALGTAAPTTTP